MSRITSNFIFNVILNITNILFPIISFPYASRIIGPDGIGQVQFVMNFIQYFIVFAALGIPIYGIRAIARSKNEYRRVFTELLSLNFILALFFSIIYYIIVFNVSQFASDLELYLISGVCIFLSFSNIDWFFSGLEKFKVIAIRSIIVKILCLILLFILVRSEQDSYGYLLVCLLAYLLNNIWNMLIALRELSFNSLLISNLKVHLKPLFFIFFSVLSITIYNLVDTLLLGLMEGYEAVGLYSSASKIPKIFIPILTSLGAVLVPSLSVYFEDKKEAEIRRLLDISLKLIVFLGIPISVGLYVMSEDIIILFSGTEFVNASLTLKILSPLVLVFGISNILSVQILTPSAHDKFVTISVTIGLLISILLNFFLIRIYSYNGSAIASLLTEVLVLLLFLVFSRRFVKLKLPIKEFASAVLISACFFPIHYFFETNIDNVFLLSLSTILSCAFVYFIIQYFIVKNEILMHVMSSKFSKK